MNQLPFGRDVPESLIQDWMTQFAESDRWAIDRLLTWFRYYDSTTLNRILIKAHDKILAKYKTLPDRIWFIPAGYVARGGSAVAHLYRTANTVSEAHFVTREDLRRIALKGGLVIFIDDFVGSGAYGRVLWDTAASNFPAANRPTAWVLMCAVGYIEGINRIRHETGFDVIAGEELPNNVRPFVKSSRVFPEQEERARALEIISRYGRKLEPSRPLGRGDLGGLVGFFFGSPDSTLPIFWSTSDSWKPLLTSVRTVEAENDPKSVGHVAEMIRVRDIQAERTSVAELRRISDYDLPREVANRILEEFKTTANLIILFEIGRRIGLSPGVLSRIPDVVRRLAHATHERESVCTAIAICDLRDAASTTLAPFVTPGHAATLDDDLVFALAEYVDGFHGAVVVGADGKILGNVLYPQETRVNNHSLLPQRYGPALSLSAATKGLLFLFAGDGRVSVFYDGSRILRHRGAGWHNDELSQDSMAHLEEAHALNAKVLFQVMRLAFEISEESHGAIFMIGDEDRVRQMCDPLPPNAPAWRPISVMKDDFREALFLARQDGACIVATDGTIVSGMMMLRPPAQDEADATLDMGARHRSAAKMSKVTKALAVVVSVSGKISVFSGGERRYTVVS